MFVKGIEGTGANPPSQDGRLPVVSPGYLPGPLDELDLRLLGCEVRDDVALGLADRPRCDGCGVDHDVTLHDNSEGGIRQVDADQKGVSSIPALPGGDITTGGLPIAWL
jgi:hypothetical protein